MSITEKGETQEIQETMELNSINKIFYNCSECSSLIEILSINENNNIIEFNCLNKNFNHNKKLTMPIKEYLEKMKKFNKNKLNKDECEIHKAKYLCYCFDCNCHLCKECLKEGNHLNHVKNNIIEIEPSKEELNIMEEIIKEYEIKIDDLSRKKLNKMNELKISLNNKQKQEEDKNKENLSKNENQKQDELKINKEKYENDINEIIQRKNEEIKLRKLKYSNEIEEINNKYKLEEEKINQNFKDIINELNKIYEEDIKNLKHNEIIENMNNLKQIIELISNTYNAYNNNYFNALNINSVLSTYMENDHIKNEIMKKISKDKYEQVYNKIKQKNINQKNIGNKNLNLNREKLKNEITSNCIEFMNDKIKEINKKWKNKIEEMKNRYKSELKEREILNNKAIEEMLNKISNNTSDIIQNQKIKYIDKIKSVLENKLEIENINTNKINNDIKLVLNDINTNKDDIKKYINDSKTNWNSIFEISKINENV